MFRIKIFVGRDISEDVQIISLQVNAMVEQPLIILFQMAQHEPTIQVSHFPAVPMVHERNCAFFPITEACPGESLWQTLRIFLVNRKLRVIRRRINVVIAILVVQAEEIAQLAASIGEPFHSFPTTRFRCWWENIGILPFVAHLRPTGENHCQALETIRFALAEKTRALVESSYVMSLAGISPLPAVTIWFVIGQNTG